LRGLDHRNGERDSKGGGEEREEGSFTGQELFSINRLISLDDKSTHSKEGSYNRNITFLARFSKDFSDTKRVVRIPFKRGVGHEALVGTVWFGGLRLLPRNYGWLF